MSQQDNTHFLFSAVPSWGHIRSFCILAARIVNENENFVVTIIVAPSMLDKAHGEILAEFRDGVSEQTRQRVRVLSTFQSTAVNPFEVMKQLAETYAAAYQTLSEGKPVTCAVKETVFDAVSAPVAVILDFFALAQFQATRAITGHSIPIMAWVTGHASSRLRFFAPESMGGIGDFGAKVDAEAARTGASPEEIGNKLFNLTEGAIVKIPGLPDMYDYEYFPQKSRVDVPVTMIFKACYTVLKECDGVFMDSAYAFEKESLEAVKLLFSEWKKETYVVGPLLPSGYGTVAQSNRGAVDIEAFLNEMLSKHGKHSVLLISFGTMFWPTAPEYVDEVIEALVEKKFPFIFAVTSPYSQIPDGLAEKVKASGLGMLTRWVPQQFILNHPATGWFLSHCGQNGVTESLASGIPLIAWPFGSDQPSAAAHLTENLNVAFELIEVRTGENGLKPLLRNGRAAKGTREAVGVEIREVIDSCRGQKGKELRENAEEIRTKFAEAWQENGASRKELHTFLAKYANIA
ncbi:hypothetical protein GALMADRAFT_138474 [Galerina marginata CBS 339.88]|uniref:UDP-glycosyltransferases domain-containing protein n=1 Tax=Galerina marginata (strain CBS 339.88) TaxID=685588 RepID=A0A067T7P5_GALM3|nr:hypothetical protein GALMADRAFT_138474 [Galerina marginata CBS 339.88]